MNNMKLFTFFFGVVSLIHGGKGVTEAIDRCLALETEAELLALRTAAEEFAARVTDELARNR